MSRNTNNTPLQRDDCMARSHNNSWQYTSLVAAIIGPFFVAGSTSIPTADGDLDPSFGSGGVVMTDFNTSTDIANAVALQPDGKLVAAGNTYTDKIGRASCRERV